MLEELYGSNEGIDIILSYSRLSDYDRNGPRALVERTHVGNDGVKLGGLIDDILFDKDSLNEKYLIFDGEKPTATLGMLVDIVLKNYNEPPTLETVVEIVKNNNFWGKIKNQEILLSRFNIPEFWDYLRAQYESKKKTLITTSEMVLANDVADTLRTHEYSAHLFGEQPDYIDVYHQVKFKYDYKGFKLRGIIDMMYVNHKDKTVRIMDLKTGKNSVEEFEKSFMKWRYYFQEAVYMLAFDVICEELGLEDYELLPFQFLYISRYEKLPLIFTVSEKWHKAALDGFTTVSGFEYKGINQILDEIKWHCDNKVYHMPKAVYESGGIVDIKSNFINLN